VRTYRGLKRQWALWSAVAQTAEAARDTFAANIARWDAARDCKLNNPARLVTSQGTSCTTNVGGSFCNFTNCCVRNIEIRFTMTLFVDSSATAWAGGGYKSASISGSFTNGEEPYAPQVAANGQVFRFFFLNADPAASSIAKMKMCVPSCGGTNSMGVVMTVHAADPDPDCQTPVVPVPPDVQAIWAAGGVPDGDPVRAVVTQAAPMTPAPAAFNCGC
jgi:hypothetical protein